MTSTSSSSSDDVVDVTGPTSSSSESSSSAKEKEKETSKDKETSKEKETDSEEKKKRNKKRRIAGEMLHYSTEENEKDERMWRGYYHRSGERPVRVPFSVMWLRALRSVISSRVLDATKYVVMYTTAFSGVVCFVALKLGVQLGIDIIAHQLCSVALGLMLVARTTNAYERFWAARTKFSELLRECYDGCRRALTWCDTDRSATATHDAKRIVGAMISIVAASEAQLAVTKTFKLRASLAPFVQDGVELDAIEEALQDDCNPVTATADIAGQVISQVYRKGDTGLTEYQAIELDNNVARMLRAASECEVIARTPTPLEFNFHAIRFLTIWCFTLPFVFVNKLGWVTIPATCVVSYALMAIDEIASVMDNPFQGYIPLLALWADLRLDVARLLEERGVDVSGSID